MERKRGGERLEEKRSGRQCTVRCWKTSSGGSLNGEAGESERSERSRVYTRRKNTKSRREEAWNAKRRKGALKPAGGRGRGATAAASNWWTDGRGEGRGKWRDKALDALRRCARGGCWRVSVLRIPRRRETAGKNVKDNGMCRVAHAWLRGMRPRNGTSVSHNVCHETRGALLRSARRLFSASAASADRVSSAGWDRLAGRKKNPRFPPRSLLRYDVICFRFAPRVNVVGKITNWIDLKLNYFVEVV